MSRLTAKANENRPVLGIFLMLAAFFFFSMIDTSVKMLTILGIPAMQLAFMRYFGHVVISLGLIARGGFSFDRFGSEKLFLVILRGALLMTATVLNFIALRYLPLTLTATITFSAPLLICALSWPLLGERVGIWRGGAVVVGFVGIIVAIHPFGDDFHWAVFLSLTGALSFAFYSLLTRKLSGIVATDTMQFYAGLVGALVMLPLAIMEWTNPANLVDWALLFMLGFFGWLGHQLLTQAHGFAPASTLTPFSYAFIVYLTIWSYFLFDHVPDAWTIAGAAIVISAGLIIWFRERMRGAGAG